jgi:hypothetical protein
MTLWLAPLIMSRSKFVKVERRKKGGKNVEDVLKILPFGHQKIFIRLKVTFSRNYSIQKFLRF